MRILITGAAGMLGSDVCDVVAKHGHEPVATDIARAPHILDITDLDEVNAALDRFEPEVVIHCAAYTNVDGAQSEPEAAYKLNALGSWTIAQACADRDIPLCAISTDFVFDGSKPGYYNEFDTPNPKSVYGASKLAGEKVIRETWRKHWIVRTAWLFGVHGKSFPNSIITAAQTKPRVNVVADQRGTPTFTRDLAETLVRIITTPGLYGTYHVANTGATTWYEFARKAVQYSGQDATVVHPIPSRDWPTPTTRPANSALQPMALQMQGFEPLRHWKEALQEYVLLRKQHLEKTSS